MSNERYVHWSTELNLPRELAVVAVADVDDGLTVTLGPASGAEPLAVVQFGDFVAYRNINESFRVRTWNRVRPGEACGMLVVENSAWLEWLMAESSGVLDDCGLKHYAIYTGDDCIDVASQTEPTVRPWTSHVSAKYGPP